MFFEDDFQLKKPSGGFSEDETKPPKSNNVHLHEWVTSYKSKKQKQKQNKNKKKAEVKAQEEEQNTHQSLRKESNLNADLANRDESAVKFFILEFKLPGRCCFKFTPILVHVQLYFQCGFSDYLISMWFFISLWSNFQ